MVAIPPTLAGRISYDPILPFQRDQLTQRYGQGTLTKVAAVYDEPFWRAKGLTGSAVTTGFPISIAYDDSPPGGRPGIAFGFVGGDNARRYAGLGAGGAPQGGADAAGPVLRRQAGAEADAVLRDQLERAGVDARLPGRDSGGWVVRQLRTAAAQPVGRIHWAGTETATYWNGYMDGAISSGERVAAEVAAAL